VLLGLLGSLLGRLFRGLLLSLLGGGLGFRVSLELSLLSGLGLGGLLLSSGLIGSGRVLFLILFNSGLDWGLRLDSLLRNGGDRLERGRRDLLLVGLNLLWASSNGDDACDVVLGGGLLDHGRGDSGVRLPRRSQRSAHIIVDRFRANGLLLLLLPDGGVG